MTPVVTITLTSDEEKAVSIGSALVVEAIKEDAVEVEEMEGSCVPLDKMLMPPPAASKPALPRTEGNKQQF
ncbi:hypothetical protein ACOMHN_024118 [Nucella lapillus]